MPRRGKVFTAKDKKMRLSWPQVLLVMAVSALVCAVLLRVGKFGLVRPTLYSTAMIGSAIAMRWSLRRNTWFWSIIAVAVALHVLLILYVPWTTQWWPPS